MEAISVSRNLQEIIAKGFSRNEVEEELLKQHFITMEQDGILKVLMGMTSIEEVLRVSKVVEE